MHNLLEEYALISIGQAQAHANSYSDTHTRATQNSYHMYEALLVSLTPEAYQRTMLLLPSTRSKSIGNSPLLLCVLSQKFTIDTCATLTRVRTNLSQIDTYMAIVEGNVEKIKDLLNMHQLTCRGKTSDDLLTNLFKGYASNADRNL